MFSNVAILAIVVAVAHGHCTVNIWTQLNAKEPLFLLNNQLWAPNGDSLRWDAGQSTMIACPENTIENTGTVTANIQCVGGQTFNLDGSQVNIASVSCATYSSGSVQNTTQACGIGGTLINLGFVVPTVGFVTYIQSCYNMQTASVIYTRHTIRGAAINHKIIDTTSHAFKLAGFNTDIRNAYTQENQQTRLENLLGSIGRDTYLKTHFLARGHLAPDADGIFRPWQRASYFFVNATPKWQKVNNGNWKAVENAARDMATRLSEDVLIFTGVHDILTLANDYGHQVAITLKDRRVEVPKWIWKIIKSPRLDAAMVLVTNNDPFRQNALPANELLCLDVCELYGWSKVNYKDSKRGYTYCCTVASLLHVIPNIPVEAHSQNVLNF